MEKLKLKKEAAHACQPETLKRVVVWGRFLCVCVSVQVCVQLHVCVCMQSWHCLMVCTRKAQCRGCQGNRAAWVSVCRCCSLCPTAGTSYEWGGRGSEGCGETKEGRGAFWGKTALVKRRADGYKRKKNTGKFIIMTVKCDKRWQTGFRQAPGFTVFH